MSKISYGQKLLSEYLIIIMKTKFIQNYRPEILYGLELDFYFPELLLGIEFNGDQHYYKTSFGSPDKQIRNDKIKKRLCRENNIKLIVLEACDLEYTRLFGKISKLYLSSNRLQNIDELKILNEKSIAYRELLKERFSSPTSRRRNTVVRHTLETQLNERFN